MHRRSAIIAAAIWASPVVAQEAVPTARPIGSPGAWIPADGYPPAAKASAEEGRVAFTLTIDETGRASDCKVTASSESPLLDDTTCNYMIANGRFEPPRDKRGKPMPSRWSSSVRWKLEDSTPPAASVAAPSPPVAVAAPTTTRPVAKPAPAKSAPPRRAGSR